MTYPLVQELAAEGIPVRLTCGVLGFSTQAFYKWDIGSWLMSSSRPAIGLVSGGCGGCASSSGCGRPR